MADIFWGANKMRQGKPVVWFVDDPKPNTFFFRSPFRSWRFIINSVLLGAACVASVVIYWIYWSQSGRYWYGLFVLMLLLLNVVYPYWWALIRHRKIKQLYLTGDIAEQSAGSPLDQLLEVADNSMNEGLRNSATMFGIFLLVLVLSKLPHLK